MALVHFFHSHWHGPEPGRDNMLVIAPIPSIENFIQFPAKEVDPDDNLLPPSQRCSYECDKDPTGPLDRKKLIEHINKEAMETPDKPELKPYVPGTVRGKKVRNNQNLLILYLTMVELLVGAA